MKIVDWFLNTDTKLLLDVNGANSAFFDSFFSLFTSKEVWFPFYILLLFLLIWKYKAKSIWVVVFLVLTIVLSDQISGLIKDLVERFRPSNEPALDGLLNLPIGKRGSFGFVSSHAANTFGLTIFLGLVSKSKRIWVSTILWAILTSYSRVYLGVHYPSDVLVGGILGSLLGWFSFFLLMLFDFQFLQKRIRTSKVWKPKYTTPVLIALVFTTVTLLMVAQLLTT